MKVCDIVLNSIWCDPRVRKQIIEYQNNGIEVECVGLKCERYDAEKIKTIPCPVTIVETDPRYVGKQKNIFRKLKRESLREKALVDAICNTKPDVIHANDLNALLPAYKAARKLGCKLVFDSHEIYVENFFLGGKKMYARYLKSKEKKICKKLDVMVCVSHAAAEYFANEYKIEKPMVVTNCSLKSEANFERTGKNEGFEILNHGQFYEGRGYELMIETARLLGDYPEIKMALRGYGRIEKKLHEMAEGLEGESVIFHPPVLVKELIPAASRSMVGVAITLPICMNFKLSVSNKLFEYASAGLPVIMSDIPEHRYLNEKYNFGIIIPENTPEAFAEAAIKLYTDKELYAKCAEGAKRLSDEVNWESDFAKLINKEREILK